MQTKEQLKENQRRFYERHPNKKKEYQKKYELENIKTIKKRKKAYRKNNKLKLQKKANEYRINKKLTDPIYKLKNSIRRNINNGLKRNGFGKSTTTINMLGCSFNEFKLYLEKQFKPWMSWDNYGLYNGKLNYGWDIDHIIPLSIATCEADIIALNHFTNLQPLCSKINRVDKEEINLRMW